MHIRSDKREGGRYANLHARQVGDTMEVERASAVAGRCTRDKAQNTCSEQLIGETIALVCIIRRAAMASRIESSCTAGGVGTHAGLDSF